MKKLLILVLVLAPLSGCATVDCKTKCLSEGFTLTSAGDPLAFLGFLHIFSKEYQECIRKCQPPKFPEEVTDNAE